MKELRFHGEAIVTGRGAIEYIKDLGIKRAFVVTGGSSMFENGTIDKIKSILNYQGCAVYVYSGIKKNPSIEEIMDGVEEARKFNPDAVIGVGGGSAIDASKVMGLYCDYADMDVKSTIQGNLPAKRRYVKLIAIPSTSGTAAEVTRTSVITFRELDLKIGIKTTAFIPDIAILDADITLSMPDNIAAETGMDAITHAVECFISKNLDDFAECLASGAVEGLFKYLPASYKDKDAGSRQKVHNYQCVAGCAFANVGVGAAHGISHSIGAHYDLGHGLINAVALPYVLQFNSRDEEVKEKIGYLAKRIGKGDFIKAVKELNSILNIPSSFKDIGIPEEDFERDFNDLVENCLKNSTAKNPVPVTKEDMVMILRCIYQGRDIE